MEWEWMAKDDKNFEKLPSFSLGVLHGLDFQVIEDYLVVVLYTYNKGGKFLSQNINIEEEEEEAGVLVDFPEIRNEEVWFVNFQRVEPHILPKLDYPEINYLPIGIAYIFPYHQVKIPKIVKIRARGLRWYKNEWHRATTMGVTLTRYENYPLPLNSFWDWFNFFGN